MDYCAFCEVLIENCECDMDYGFTLEVDEISYGWCAICGDPWEVCEGKCLP